MYEELLKQIEELRTRLDYLESVEMANTDYYLEVARGNVTGMTALNKFGRNTDIDTGTEDVWDGGGTWVWPTAARVHNIASSSANDASPAGTGARTLLISGLDTNFAEISETITMNGTSNVATSNSYIIIFRMKVVTAGSGRVNAGTITATAQTDSTVTAQIGAGNGQTLMAIWQVPAGKSLYMTKYYVSVDGTTAAQITAALWATQYVSGSGHTWQLKHTQKFTNGQELVYEFNPPFKIDEKSIVRIAVTSSANNQDVSAGFDGVFG